MMSPLHPRQLTLLRLRSIITAAVVLVLVLMVDASWIRLTDVPFGLASGVAAIVLVAAAILMPLRRYRSWGYRIEEDELHVGHGLWTRTSTVVPFARVQHIDVTQGPLERRFGLGTLVLHTAGTRSSAVHLPGLAYEEAGAMRDRIRSTIRKDIG